MFFNVAVDGISGIYVKAYKCAGSLKKFDLRVRSDSHAIVMGPASLRLFREVRLSLSRSGFQQTEFGRFLDRKPKLRPRLNPLRHCAGVKS